MSNKRDVRRQLEEQLEQIERRLQKIERDRRRESNTLGQDWEDQATVRQNDEVLDGLEEEGTQQAEGPYGLPSSE